MASQEDTDDLYADLYGGDGTGTGDVVDLGGEERAGDDQDLIGYDDEDKNAKNDDHGDGREHGNTDKTGESGSAAPSGGSFIPPPSTSQAQPGLQIKGSFIPPAANQPPPSSSNVHGDIRDLTPATHNDAASTGQQNQQHGFDGSHGQDGQAGSDGRAIMPHEMPEEG